MAWQALQEAIQFGTAFKCLLGQILSTDPLYGPFFLSKVVLSNAYMRVWVHLEELPRFAFIASLHPLDSDPLIGFHLSLTMGFMDSALFFLLHHRDGGRHGQCLVGGGPRIRLAPPQRPRKFVPGSL